MSKSKKSIVSSVLSVSGILVIAKLLGFVKQLFIAKTFGATNETDVVLLSQGIITDFEYILSQVMITAFVPIYISVKSDNNKDEKVYVGNVCTLFSVIIVFISVVLSIAAPVVAKLLAPGYNSDQLLLLIKYVRIYSTIPVVLFLMALLNALLKANERFVPGELLSVNQSVIYIVISLLGAKIFGVDALIIAFFIYAIGNLFYLLICTRKLWKGPCFSFWHDTDIIQLLKMIWPLLLGLSTVYLNQQVDRVLGTGLGEGTVTALSYGAVLSNLITGFISSICAIEFTYVANLVVENKNESAGIFTYDIMLIFVTALIPVTLITVFYSYDIITVVFGYGEFDSNAVDKASQALIGYGFVFIPYVIRELLTRLQYSYKESKKPMVNSVISIMVNIVLSIVLSKTMGILGIAFASSVSVLVCAILNIISARKYINSIHFTSIVKPIIHWAIGALGMILYFCFLKHITVDYKPFVRLIIVSLGGFAVYIIIELPIIRNIVDKYNSHSM